MLYYYDFRGRKYPNTAYLHEQGSDISKGLLLLKDGKPITKEGFYWLLISLAGNWAGNADREDGLKTDKIPIDDRIKWGFQNEQLMIDCANDPIKNTMWMSADKPWQFIAGCIELRNFRNSQEHKDDYSYVTRLVCFVDG